MLDELFEEIGHKKRHSGHYKNSHDSDFGHHSQHNDHFQDDDRVRNKHDESRHHHRDLQFGHFPLTALLKNRNLMIIAGIVAFIAVMVLIALLIILFPVLKRAWEYVNTNGIKGIIDAVGPWINSLWQGNKA